MFDRGRSKHFYFGDATEWGASETSAATSAGGQQAINAPEAGGTVSGATRESREEGSEAREAISASLKEAPEAREATSASREEGPEA